jgi:hypothetical protein
MAATKSQARHTANRRARFENPKSQTNLNRQNSNLKTNCFFNIGRQYLGLDERHYY